MMKKVYLLVVVVLFLGCQNSTKKGDSFVSKSSSDLVSINYNTSSGIPEFSSITKEPVMLSYNFIKGDSVSLNMDYDMVMDMMGQKMPMKMGMEIKYKILDVDSSRNAKTSVEFLRIKMNIKGAQTLDFDSSNPDDLKNNPAAKSFLFLLHNKIYMTISPKGKLIDIDMSKIFANIPDRENAEVKKQIEQMSNQFSQNTFIPLPEKPVKAGDVYDVGIVHNNVSGMDMDMDMKYRVLSVSLYKKLVLLAPEGHFNLGQKTESSKIRDNEISGWVILNLNTGFMEASNMKMKMNISSTQMGQEMNMKVKMNMSVSVCK